MINSSNFKFDILGVEHIDYVVIYEWVYWLVERMFGLQLFGIWD
jgi:hypothetical protein